MTREWEEFTQKSNYKAEMFRVSLNGRGQFVFNKKAVRELGEPAAVVLYYERSNRLIGVKGSLPDVEHSYELKLQGASQNYSLRAKSFCTFYSINVGDTVVFNDVKCDDGMLILSLDNVTEIIRRARPTEFPVRFPEPVRRVQPAKFSTLVRMRLPNEE